MLTELVVASEDAGVIKEYGQKVELALTDYQVSALTKHMVMNHMLILGYWRSLMHDLYKINIAHIVSS
jgi:hypothetical protein